MSNNGAKVTDEMLVKYLAEELPEEDKQVVANWLEENEANRSTFEAFKLIWDESKHIALPANVNEDEAWQRFQERVQKHHKQKNIPLIRVLKIAAILLLLAGSTGILFFLSGRHTAQPVVIHNQIRPEELIRQEIEQLKEEDITIPVSKDSNETITSPEDQKTIAYKDTDHKAGKKKDTEQQELIGSTEDLEKLIRNSTPCPIQICITQTLDCNGRKPATTSTCSTLEPDQSGQLCIKSSDKKLNKCRMAVDEIRIEKISTGEAIVLNDHSSPATAQEVFKYISGHKQGSITAGIFNDCNTNGTYRLTLENEYGNLKLQ